MALVLVAGAVFAGGSSQPAASGEEPLVRFMTWESEAMNQAILASFSRVGVPGVKVALEPAPLQEYGIRVQSMLVSGTAPDVFLVGNDMAIDFFAAGLTADLTNHLNADQEFLRNFYSGSLTTYYINNRYVGLPALINLYGIFYNKKYFDDAGIPYPKNEWTFQEMLQIADRLKDTGQNRYGLYNRNCNVFQMSLYSASKDGTPFTDASYPVRRVQASPAFIEGVQLVQEAIRNRAITGPTYDSANVTGMFMQGAIPMLYYGQWAADEMIRNAPASLQWGYVAHPRVNNNVQIFDMTGWAINKSTKDLDAAYKVLRHIHTDTYRLVLGDFPVAPSSYGPANQGYYSTLANRGHQDLADGMEYMLNAQMKLPVRFMDTWKARANSFLDADWNLILNGEIPVTQIQSRIVDNINSVIR